MSWKTGLGEPGRLHSLVNLHQWRLPPQQVVTLKAEHIPCTVSGPLLFAAVSHVDKLVHVSKFQVSLLAFSLQGLYVISM